MTRILITGAAGGVGQAMLAEMPHSHGVLATDIRQPAHLPSGAEFRLLDVRGGRCRQGNRRLETRGCRSHWPPSSCRRKAQPAPLNTPSMSMAAANVLDACIAHGVRRIAVTSSGAAYGYHADNPVPLRETDMLRGNEEFAYSHHKRLVEEMLADARRDHPELEQVVLRVGTVLGEGMENQITALFRRDAILGISRFGQSFRLHLDKGPCPYSAARRDRRPAGHSTMSQAMAHSDRRIWPPHSANRSAGCRQAC